MIIAIADDLIGAVEVAGIGHAHGLSTTVLTDLTDNLPVCDLMVVATQTRKMSENAAVAETHMICDQIKQGLPKLTEARHAAMTPLQRAQALSRPSEVLHIYKKTDELLRGHVHLELRALVEESRYEQVIYVPANPSKGQTIRGGRYFVQGTPIDQTKYKSDPDYPIQTANVADAIGVRPGSRLRIADAEDQQDIQRAVKLALNNHTPTLLAGSTDLFAALLTELGHKTTRHKQFGGLSEKGPLLLIASRTPSSELITAPYLQRHATTLATMPQEVYELSATEKITVKDATDRWMGRLKQSQVVSGKATSVMLAVPYPTPETQSGEASVAQVTAEMAQRIVLQQTLGELVIEGGTLAMATMRKLGWTRFMVTQVVAPGVVRMHCLNATHTHMTLVANGSSWEELLQ